MDRGAHAADALRPDPGLAWIAAAQDQFDTTEHGSRTPGIGHRTTIDFCLDAQMAFNTGHRVNYDACHWLLLCFPRRLTARRRWYCCGHRPHAVANRARDPMNHGCARHGGGDSQPDLAGGYVRAEARNCGQPVVERRAGIPEAVRGAAQTAVTGLHRPACTIIPTYRGTIESRFRTLAAHFVQTPAPAMAFVIPFLNVTTSVIVGAPLTLVMDDASVRE